VKKVDGVYKIYNRNLGLVENLELISWIKEVESLGAGEILVTSVDKDGSEDGYDLELIELVSKEVSIPVIANAGAGKPQDCVEAVKKGADAIAAASIFHFTQYTPNNIKEELHKNNFSVRLH